MSFFDFLQTVGGRLGILETASGAASGECAKIVTRTVTLEELKMQIHPEEARTLADLPAELTVSYEKIFEAAGARAAAGTWDLARLKKFLQTLSTEDRAATQKTVLEAISSDGASTEDLIKEAAAQDQALD